MQVNQMKHSVPYRKYDFSQENLGCKVNWLFQLNDSTLAAEFVVHNKKQRSRGYLLYFLIICTVLAPLIIFVLIKDVKNWYTNAKIVPLSFIHAISAIITLVSGWKLYLRQRQLTKVDTEHAHQIKFSNITSSTFTGSGMEPRTWFLHIFQFWKECYSGRFVNTIFIIASQFILTCIFIRRSWSENCGESSAVSFGILICKDPSDNPEYFLGTAIIMIFSPVLAFTSIPDTPIEAIWINIILSFFIFAVTAILKGVERMLVIGVVLFLSSIFAVVDIQIRNILLFLSNRNFQEIIEENEQMAEKKNEEEMRHMIGNVAHDLKTVRSNKLFFNAIF